MDYRHRLLISAAACTALYSTSAHAQEAPADNRTERFGEIIVTANKRSERLQDVPIAISAYTSDMREQLGIRTADDLAEQTPGMSYIEYPNRIVLRGVGRATNTVGSDPGIATYYDGVYNSESWVLVQHPLLIDRIEILRGPQGTLYGRNSIGGAVNVISKRPTRDFEGQIDLQVGSLGANRQTGFISGPVAEGVGFRLSGDRYDAPAFIHNDFSGKKLGAPVRIYAEGQVEAEIGTRGNLRLVYGYTDQRGRGVPSVRRAPYDTTSYSIGFTVNPTLGYGGTNPGIADPYTIDTNIDERRVRKDHRVVGEFTLDLGGALAKYTGGFLKGNSQFTGDFDQSSRGDFVDPVSGVTVSGDLRVDVFTDAESFSNEFNLSSPDKGERLKWIFGLYQYHERSFQSLQVYAPGQPQIVNATVRAPDFAVVPNPKGQVFVNEGQVIGDSFAIYGQTSYDIDDRLALTLGARYSWDEKRGTEFQRIVVFDPVAISEVAAFEFRNRRRDLRDEWQGGTYRATLEYKFDTNSMLYASFATGYKSGGFNLGAYSDPVREEELTSYELGYKGRLGDRLQLNVSAFYYDYTDAQIFTRTCVLTPQGLCGVSISAFINAPKARSMGIEVETQWRPFDAIQIYANYGYLDAEFRRFDNVVDPFNLSGAPLDLRGGSLPVSPKHKFSLSGTYSVALPGGSLDFSTTYSWQSRSHFDLYDHPLYQQKAGGEAAARLIYRDDRERFNILAYVDNIFDTKRLGNVELEELGGGSFGRSEQVLAPRTFGVEVQLPF